MCFIVSKKNMIYAITTTITAQKQEIQLQIQSNSDNYINYIITIIYFFRELQHQI